MVLTTIKTLIKDRMINACQHITCMMLPTSIRYTKGCHPCGDPMTCYEKKVFDQTMEKSLS